MKDIDVPHYSIGILGLALSEAFCQGGFQKITPVEQNADWGKMFYRVSCKFSYVLSRGFTDIVETANLIRFIYPSHSHAGFQVCNKWMVNHFSEGDSYV